MESAMETIGASTCIEFLDIQSWIGRIDTSKLVKIKPGGPAANVGVQYGKYTNLWWKVGWPWGRYVL